MSCRTADQQHRDGVAGIVDEQLIAGRVVLPYRHRRLHRPAAVKVTVPTVTIAVRMSADVFVPQDLQRHVLALEFPMDQRPIRLRAPTVPGLRPGRLQSASSRTASLTSSPNGRDNSAVAHVAASRAPSGSKSTCDQVLARSDISTSRGHAASPVSPQASRSFLATVENFTPAEHPRQRGRRHFGIRVRPFLGIAGRDHFGIRGRIALGFARTNGKHPEHCRDALRNRTISAVTSESRLSRRGSHGAAPE
ncbi:hypothetical protein FB001_1542 [Ensifer sp. SEMIA 135]|nr:hypothetical protein FB001_1542 [Ensifer sp. SEMIA 135]